MNDGEQPQHQNANGQIESPLKTTEDAPKTEPATGKQLAQAEQKIEDRMSAFERATLHLTWLGIFIGILTAVIFAGQLYEMYEGGAQTDKMIDAANRNAAAAKGFADSAASINTGIQQMESAMEKSASVAQANYVATVEQAEISQRAWVSGMISPVGRIEAGKPILFRVLITNTGRTPALGVLFLTKKASVTIKQSPNLDILRPVFKKSDMHSQGQIQPNHSIISDLEYTFSQHGADLINSQKARIYIAGKITYNDVYGVHHWTTFCDYYLTGGMFATYSKYNDVDKNQPKVILPKPN